MDPLDAFISYSHIDNAELVEGRKGWVTNLHRALELRIGQLLGEQPRIWRDPKLQGNDLLAETLVDRLKHASALVPVLSPRYIRSEWTRRELDEFWRTAQQEGGICFGDKARIFKVVKTPVPLEMQPPELQPLIGYEFFKIDPDSGRIRELDGMFGPEAQREFWDKLYDLAEDIYELLEDIRDNSRAAPSGVKGEKIKVFLAETTSDLKDQRDSIKRDLQQHGYAVFPMLDLPRVEAELEALIRADLARCDLSIHPVGRKYSFVPEGGGERSLVEIQNALAVERSKHGNFSRLVWIPRGLQPEDKRQSHVIDQLRLDPDIQPGSDLLETSLEELRTVYQERLKDARRPVPSTPASSAADQPLVRIYLVYDRRDAPVAGPVAQFLFQIGLEVIRPVFEGEETELREYHEENLRTADGILILIGRTSECWWRKQLCEVKKSKGYGRTKPPAAVALALVPPSTAEKEVFSTREAQTISLMDGVTADRLQPFLAGVNGG